MDVQTSPMASLPAWDEDRVVSSVSVFPGGSVVNTARHFHSLVRGDAKLVPSLCVTLGDDALGSIMASTLAAEGISPSRIVTAHGTPMSTCLVLVGPGGQRAFVSTRGTSNDRTTAGTVEASGLLGDVHHLHVSGLFSTLGLQTRAFAALLKQRANEHGAEQRRRPTLSLDTQYDATARWRGAEDTVLELIQLVDVFLPNHTEACGIAAAWAADDEASALAATGAADAATALAALGSEPEAALRWLMAAAPSTLIVVKAGPDGALLGKHGQGVHRVPCPPLSQELCVDTCGAGDCFSAAFLSEALPQLNSESGALWTDPSQDCVQAAVRTACAAGTWCVQQTGACVKPITRADLL